MRTWYYSLEDLKSTSCRKGWRRREIKKEKKKEHLLLQVQQEGTLRTQLPLTQKKPRKEQKNVMIAIWGDSDISSLDEEEEEEGIANLCLMANDDKVYLENFFDFSFVVLVEAFNDLMDEHKKIKLKNKEIKKINLFLAEEKNNILIEKDKLVKEKKILAEERENFIKSEKSLVEENERLRKEINILKPLVKKFTLSS